MNLQIHSLDTVSHGERIVRKPSRKLVLSFLNAMLIELQIFRLSGVFLNVSQGSITQYPS